VGVGDWTAEKAIATKRTGVAHMADFQFIDPSTALVFGPFQAGDVPAPTPASGTTTVNTPGAGNFTWPAGVGSVTVELWAGGAGGNSAATAGKSGGGGGGAYSRSVVQGVPGTDYPYFVGGGGLGGVVGASGNLGTDGTDTTYRTNVVVAKAGEVGALVTDGGTGGLASAGTGQIKFSGGDGDDGGATGGGGGSSAGTAATGVNASGATGGVAPSGGGNGGNAGTVAPSPGSAPGGGGGGCAADSFAGGAGAAGRIKFSW